MPVSLFDDGAGCDGNSFQHYIIGRQGQLSQIQVSLQVMDREVGVFISDA